MTDNLADAVNLTDAARAAGVTEELIERATAADADAVTVAIEIALGLGSVFNAGNEEAARKYVAPDFVDHEAPPGSPGGPEGYLATARYMRTTFSDATWHPEDFFATGDRFAVRLTFSGRQTGEFLGVPPTGKHVSVQHLHLYRVENGQVAEHWGGRDDLSLLIQLGVLEAPKSAPATAGAYAPRTGD
jgi:predicted ester cyclase